MSTSCRAETVVGSACTGTVVPDAPVALCVRHLLLTHDWMTRDVGVTDLLPSPCLSCGSRLGVTYPSGWLCAICEWRVGAIPDSGVTEPRVDVVYYIRLGAQVKIGTSANPRRRVSSLPHDEVLALERGDRMLEQRRHREFAAHRIPRTEWFHENDELSAHIAELAMGVDDPWSRFDRWLSEARALRG